MPKMLDITKAIAIFEKRLQTSLSICFDRNDSDALSQTLDSEINRLLKKTWDVIQQNREPSRDDDNADLQWQPLAAAFRDCMLRTIAFYLRRAQTNKRPVKPEMILTVVNCQRNFTGVLSNLNSIYNENEQVTAAKSSVATTKKSPGGIFAVRASSSSSNSSEVRAQTVVSLTQKQLLPYIMPWPRDAIKCDYQQTKTETLVEMAKSVIMNYARADEQRLLAYRMLNELNGRADYAVAQHNALCLCMQRNDGVITLEQDEIVLANDNNNDDDDTPKVSASTVSAEEVTRQQQQYDYMQYSTRLLNVMCFSIEQCFPTAVEKRNLIRAHLHEFCYWGGVDHHPLYYCLKLLDDTQRAELLLQFVADCRDALPTTGKSGSTISELPQIQDEATSNLSQVTADNASQLFATLIGQFNLAKLASLARLAKSDRETQQNHPKYFLENEPVMIGKLLNTLGALPTIGKQVVHYYLNYLCELVRQVDRSWNTSPVQLVSLLSEIKNGAVQEAIVTAYFEISDETDEAKSFQKRFHPDVVTVFFTNYGETLQRMSTAAMKMSKQEQEKMRRFRRQLFVSCTVSGGMSLEKLRVLFVNEHRFLLEEMVQYVGGGDPGKFRRDDELKWQCVRLNLNTDLSCELLTSMQLTLEQIETCLSEHTGATNLQTALLTQLDRHFNLIYQRHLNLSLAKTSTKQQDKLAVEQQQRTVVDVLVKLQGQSKVFDILLKRYSVVVKALPQTEQDRLLLALVHADGFEQCLTLLADQYIDAKDHALTQQRLESLLDGFLVPPPYKPETDETSVAASSATSSDTLQHSLTLSQIATADSVFVQRRKDCAVLLHKMSINKKFCQGFIQACDAEFLVRLAIVAHCPNQFVEHIALPSLSKATDVKVISEFTKLLLQNAPSSIVVFKGIYFNKKLNVHLDHFDLFTTLTHTLDNSSDPQQSKMSSNSGVDSDDVELKCRLLADRNFMKRLSYAHLCQIADNEKITSHPILQRLVQTLLEIAYDNPLRLDKDSMSPDLITKALAGLFNRKNSPRIHQLRAMCLQCAFDAQNKTILLSRLSRNENHAARADYYQTIAFNELDKTQLAAVGKYLPVNLLPFVLDKFSHDDATYFASQMLNLFLCHPNDISELILSKADPFILNQLIGIKIDEVLLNINLAQAIKLKRLRSQLIVNEILQRKRIDSVKDYTDSRSSLLDYLGNITSRKQEKSSIVKVDAKDLQLVSMIATQAPLTQDVFTDLLLSHPNLPTEIVEKLWPASMNDALIDQLVLGIMAKQGNDLQQYHGHFKTLLAHYTYAKNAAPLACLNAFTQRLEAATCTYTQAEKQRLNLFVYHTTSLTQGSHQLLNCIDTKTYHYYLNLDTRLLEEYKQRVTLQGYSHLPEHVFVSNDRCYVDHAWAVAWEAREKVIKNARRCARLEASALLLPEKAFHGLYDDGNIKAVLNEQDIDALKLFEPARVLEVMRFANDEDTVDKISTHTLS